MIKQKPTKKTRRKRRKNHYFTKDMRNDHKIPAFDEMVNKIIFTYKFTNLPNIDVLRDECKIWLMTILDKYDPNKGSKAFSYFSVITKNWFIHKVKKQQKQNRTEINIDNIAKNYEEQYLSTEESYLSEREKDEFWIFLIRRLFIYTYVN